MSKNTELVLAEVAEKLDNSILPLLTDKQLGNFAKGFQTSKAIITLQGLLTAEVMKDIMALQGSSLGFKTDKDEKGGYPLEIVRNCVIDASLQGLPLTGNHFNIISGNVYATKNGIDKQLKDLPGLVYDIVFGLPRINADKTSAAVTAKITWDYHREHKEKDNIELPIRMNSYMGVDAVLGKAKRKARAWLYETITGYEVAEGEVSDVDVKVVGSKIEPISVEGLLASYEQIKESLSVDERKDAERIIFNKEDVSYPKLQKLLNSKANG